MRDADRTLAKQCSLFRDLQPEALARLLEDAFVQSLPKGAVLFEQGARPQFLHVILSGRVALVGGLTQEGSVVVEFFNAGDPLIVPAVVLDLEYLLSAEVVADARILMISAALFRTQLDRELALARAATRLLSAHWRRLILQIKQLKLLAATPRLGAYLLSLARTENGRARVRLNEERRLLATRLGMTPESLSRAFARLRDHGVSAAGDWVEIEEVSRLRRYVESRPTAARRRSLAAPSAK